MAVGFVPDCPKYEMAQAEALLLDWSGAFVYLGEQMPQKNLRRLVQELKDRNKDLEGAIARAVKDRDAANTQNALLQGRVIVLEQNAKDFDAFEREMERCSVIEAEKAAKAQWALEILGLPGLDDENFDARVVYTAFKLKRLVPAASRKKASK